MLHLGREGRRGAKGGTERRLENDRDGGTGGNGAKQGGMGEEEREEGVEIMLI